MINSPRASDYVLQVEVLDRDHQELIRLINELQSAFCCGQEQDFCLEALRRLESYVQYHFDHEAQLMADTSFPAEESRAHSSEHDQLLKRVRRWRSKLDRYERTASIAAEIIGYLYAWLEHHIKEMDTLLAKHLKTRAGVESPVV